MIKKIAIAILLLNCSSTFATPALYLGTINRVWPNDPNGGFIITFSAPSSLDDCKNTYAYFKSQYLQPDLLKMHFQSPYPPFIQAAKLAS